MSASPSPGILSTSLRPESGNTGVNLGAADARFNVGYFQTLDATTIVGGGISGSGTSGKIPKWTGTTALGNSLLSDDGTNVTLGSGQLLFPTGVGLTNGGAGILKVTDGATGTGTLYAGKFTTTGTGTFAITTALGEIWGVTGGGQLQLRTNNDANGTVNVQSASPNTNTTGGASIFAIKGGSTAFQPASGSGSYAMVELNPTINGTSSGTAYGLVVASNTNVLTGGTIKLLSLGTTTTDAFTGYAEKFSVNAAAPTSGNTIVTLTYHNGTSVVTQLVTVGAADSGGAGFKVLRIPN